MRLRLHVLAVCACVFGCDLPVRCDSDEDCPNHCGSYGVKDDPCGGYECVVEDGFFSGYCATSPG